MSVPIFREHQYIVIDFNSVETQPTSIKTNESFEVLERLDDFKIRHFTGHAIHEDVILDYDFSRSDANYPPVKAIADAMGEWVAVAENSSEMEREFLIFSDTFGYCPIFYTVTASHKLVISDSFHGAASALQTLNQPVTINVPYYISSITSRVSQFQTVFSDQTMVNEIKLLPPDKAIHVSQSTGVTFINRSELGYAFKSRDYDTAISEGVNQAVASLHAVTNLPNTDRRLTLSGGVDSRLVLALLITAGIHHEYQVFSVDPRSWSNKNTKNVIERDIEIADLIRRRYSMKWWHAGDRTAIPTGFLDSLAAYQSHRSNLYFSYRPTNMFTIQNMTTVTLRGGGGETFSSSSSGIRLSAKYASEGKGKDPSTWFARHILRGSEATPAFRATVRGFAESIYRAYERETVQSTLDSHFLHTRNRTHFGHMSYSRTSNEVAVHMLSNPYFLSAAGLVPEEDKAAGKVVADIFSATEAELLQYPLESSYWSSKLQSTENPASYAPSNSWAKEYDASKKSSKLSVLTEKATDSAKPDVNFNQFDVAYNYLKYAFSLIEELAPSHLTKDLTEQHSVLLRKAASRRLNIYHMVAKSMSVLDAFIPQPSLGAIHRHSCSKATQPVASGTSAVRVNGLFQRQISAYEIPTFEQDPTLEIDGDSIIVDSNHQSEDNAEYQFAFYLIKDGERVAQRWYEDAPRAIFENIYGDGTYVAVSHVRCNGRTEPTFFDYTESVKL